MPEQPYFYEYLTGFEFLDLCGRLNGMGRENTRRRSAEMLARVRLSEAGNMAIRKYSKGMMQRLGLAQALLHDPELVILDEPMSGLDPMGRMEVRGIITELKAAAVPSSSAAISFQTWKRSATASSSLTVGRRWPRERSQI